MQKYDSLNLAGVWIKENFEEFREKVPRNIAYTLQHRTVRGLPYVNFLWIIDDLSEEEKILFIQNQKMIGAKSSKKNYEEIKIILSRLSSCMSP